MKEKPPGSLVYHLAQLRHAYTHLINGTFEPKSLAEGIISPAIAAIERHLVIEDEELDRDVAEILENLR